METPAVKDGDGKIVLEANWGCIGLIALAIWTQLACAGIFVVGAIEIARILGGAS
jgi:hypothetical protein